MIAATAILILLLASAGAVLAKTMNCPIRTECTGTTKADTIRDEGERKVLRQGRPGQAHLRRRQRG